jgi:hypothetical protein
MSTRCLVQKVPVATTLLLDGFAAHSNHIAAGATAAAATSAATLTDACMQGTHEGGVPCAHLIAGRTPWNSQLVLLLLVSVSASQRL